MSAIQVAYDDHGAVLRTAYNQAFAAWVKQVSLLQRFAGDPNATDTLVENVRAAAKRAEVSYRESRDRLWRYLSAGCEPRARSNSSTSLRASL